MRRACRLGISFCRRFRRTPRSDGRDGGSSGRCRRRGAGGEEGGRSDGDADPVVEVGGVVDLIPIDDDASSSPFDAIRIRGETKGRRDIESDSSDRQYDEG